jgi:hypothetical protein
LKKKQAGFAPPKGKEGVAAPRNMINLNGCAAGQHCGEEAEGGVEASRSVRLARAGCGAPPQPGTIPKRARFAGG